MPWDVLLLPLLGGFWFITLYYRSRFRAIQAPRHQLLFYAATMGVVLAVVARGITLSLAQLFPDVATVLKDALFPGAYTGTALTAFMLGPLIAGILNRKTDRSEANRKAIRRWGDELEKLLLEAQESNEFVVCTLKSSKVYIGLVYELPANLEGPSKWVTLVPFLSGYRERDTRKLIVTTDYTDVLVEFAEDGPASEQAFLRVIRADDIEICGRFDQAVWDRFHAAEDTSTETKSPDAENA